MYKFYTNYTSIAELVSVEWGNYECVLIFDKNTTSKVNEKLIPMVISYDLFIRFFPYGYLLSSKYPYGESSR